MAMIGYLGGSADNGIPFIVSREVFRTPKNMKWSGSARYAVHERHATHALTEFTGLDPDCFSFDMLLTAEMLSLPEGDAFTKLMNCHALACADELRGSHTPKGTKRSLIASEQSRLNRYPPQP